MSAIRIVRTVGYLSSPRKLLALGLALAWVLIGLGCSSTKPVQTARLAGETELGWTKAAHSLTRGHNRKVIYDTNFKHWYIFWLRDDGEQIFNKNEEGVVYQVSSDALTWSNPVVVEPFQNGGMTAFDVVLVGTRLYLLGLTDYPGASGKTSKYGVRELNINEDGSLTIAPPQVVYDNSGGDSTSAHFYGSLLHDSKGYFLVAARVGDSSPNTHADVIRSAEPDSMAAWGASRCIGQACNKEWTDPYAASGRTLLQGTIASRLLDLGEYGVGLVTYNKHSDEKRKAQGQILFVRNPSRAHDGWEPTSIVLTDRANQYMRPMRPGSAPGADRTRLDDRRFAAVVDPRTHIIHVVYVVADTGTSESANLRYFTLSPPYTPADKSAETAVISSEVDGAHLSIDTRTRPCTLYLFYVANEHPNYQLRMIMNAGQGWSPAVNVSDGVGVVRYPQPPETVVSDEIVIGYQAAERQPEGMIFYTIVGKIVLER